ncbi:MULTISPECIES: hypothetical protein [Kamptonema]|uniref:hypothetical protein n=1 Tax=Kamptonema TaxID=1501433 RepID=UPI0001DAC1CD|nr:MULTISPECIES: hypothetical protein [Kamptonema]CBN58970.1 hypothetical protein OSCI_3960016 [Kamptonema sp. PCC 6506]
MADVWILVEQEKDLQNASIEDINHEVSSKIKVCEEKKKEFEEQVKKAPKTGKDKNVPKWKGEASSDSLRFAIELLEELLENINNIFNKSSNKDSIDTTIFNDQKDVFLKRLTEFLQTRYKIHKIHKKEHTILKNKAEAAQEMLDMVKELLGRVN